MLLRFASNRHHCHHSITAITGRNSSDASDSSDDLSGFVSDFNPVIPVRPVEIFSLHWVMSDDAPVRLGPSSLSSLHHCYHFITGDAGDGVMT